MRQEFHGKSGWASLHGLGALPCVGMQQKEPFTKPGKTLYFLFHLFSTALLGVQCLPAWIWLSYMASWGGTAGQDLPGTGEIGEICPPTQRAWGWLGWGGSHRDRDSPHPLGTQPRCPRAATGSAQSLGREHRGLGRISKRREDGGAEDGHAEGWQGLGLVRQHMPLSRARHVSARPWPCSSNHPLVALLL